MLVAENATLKSKVESLEEDDMQRDQQGKLRSRASPSPSAHGAAAGDAGAFGALHEKYAAANSRCVDLQAKLTSASTMLGKYQRALAKEVGKDVNLAKVLDESSDWRGRAQQIHLLTVRLDSPSSSPARVSVFPIQIDTLFYASHTPRIVAMT